MVICTSVLGTGIRVGVNMNVSTIVDTSIKSSASIHMILVFVSAVMLLFARALAFC